MSPPRLEIEPGVFRPLCERTSPLVNLHGRDWRKLTAALDALTKGRGK